MSAIRLYVALYADADVRSQVVTQIRERNYDVAYAHELGHGDWSDEEHLIYAAENGRAVFTHNIKHFEPLYKAWWEAGRTHAGMIVSPQLRPAKWCSDC